MIEWPHAQKNKSTAEWLQLSRRFWCHVKL